MLVMAYNDQVGRLLAIISIKIVTTSAEKCRIVVNSQNNLFFSRGESGE